ncbi:GAF domain-containing protein [Dyadobacter psychrotolerans]|uniref:GAF domain-containing protein n=1 Tax=Dyadobacter psychrotolerans TaxID=2541721 RepID=A0A4R5DST0_9BACT|nr:GAF domain-containing protein [Dyadobacter psychrotolerans]TDE17492.1 GAF domain-containing protein [Dyadobacter psychrotolerans]
MEPLNLLIVAIRQDWQPLISESLSKAGYQFQAKKVDTKQQALEACHQSKFDLVISNCTLPDGQVADLVSVLGRLSPCLVMAEGHCPATSEKALSLLATEFYITSSEQSSWLSAMETTLSKWKSNAEQKIEKIHQDSSSLHKKVLAICEEELSAETLTEKQADHSIANVFTIILEALDLSRIYLYKRKALPGGEETIVQQSEVSAPGVNSRTVKTVDVPYFKRWNNLFKSKQHVQGDLTSLPAGEQQWLNQRDAQSVLAVPIHNNETWNGFIGLEDMMNPRQWSEAEINLLESVAHLIQQKQLTQKLQALNKNRVFTSQV